jgi:hypothetical protein
MNVRLKGKSISAVPMVSVVLMTARAAVQNDSGVVFTRMISRKRLETSAERKPKTKMKTILLITMIVAGTALAANITWVILGARKDKITGDKWATIDRNLKGAGINVGIAIMCMVVVIIARLYR